jgi:hypothetical protein
MNGWAAQDRGRRGRVDYRMARRATVRDVREGLTPRDAVCDAHPDLVRAGTWIGQEVDDDCPMCDGDTLAHVTYIFPSYGPASRRGRAVPRDSLAAQVRRHGDLVVYTVEVCRACAWHHLIEKFDLLARNRAISG